jgi:predicted Zn finger-like uncharacterized protein
VAIVCPHCAAPAVTSAGAVDAAGRMLRCARCGTKWLSRIQGGGRRDQPSLPRVSKPGRPRFERVIDHVDLDFPGTVSPRAAKPERRAEPSGPKSRSAAWRYPRFATAALTAWSSAVAVVLLVLVAIVAFDPSVVGASPDDGAAQFSGLEVNLVRSTTRRVHTGQAVVVLGEIANRTSEEIAVPAVRLSVRSDGEELYSWIVEPTKTQLAGGSAIQFQSLSTAPMASFDEVALRFVERQDISVGAL